LKYIRLTQHIRDVVVVFTCVYILQKKKIIADLLLNHELMFSKLASLYTFFIYQSTNSEIILNLNKIGMSATIDARDCSLVIIVASEYKQKIRF